MVCKCIHRYEIDVLAILSRKCYTVKKYTVAHVNGNIDQVEMYDREASF